MYNKKKNEPKPRNHRVNPKNQTIKDEKSTVRLNKFIAETGLCSRRKADDLISEGRVRVNGNIIIDLGTIVTLSDNITVDGDPLKAPRKYLYILLNKPKDTISTTSDELGRKTVLDLIPIRTRLYPIGRLDRNTTGVLLITNDGELTARLTHPKFQVERAYKVRLDRKISTAHAREIAAGIELEDGYTNPCEVFVNPKDTTEVMLVLREGKNREVRRMFEAVGYEVRKLDRKTFAGLSASGLARGEYRYLERKEVLALRRLVGI